MKLDTRLTGESERLAALERYDILDTAPEREFENLTALVQSVFDAPMVAISLVDGERQWFKSRIGIAAAETPREVAFCDHTVRGGAELAVEDAAADPRFRDNPLVTGSPGVRVYLGASLTSPQGAVVGALWVLDTRPRRFSAEETAMLANFAALVVSQMELRTIASRDALTGALTRRAFEAAAQKELARHARHGLAAAIALFDLDHFKAINDTYGHAAGDAILRRVAEVCEAGLRETDCLGRIGGEEFAALLVGAGPEEALVSAERLRRAIEAAVAPDYPDIRFTASIGIAACSGRYAGPAEWLAAADACLYAAKRAGRNCCVAEAAPH